MTRVDPIVKGKRIFMVGAGGIGCELLKNLVMAGFDDIQLIDLDTIDVSNLNRQFLFRREHVGQPKAMVARDAALAMRPSAKIVAHHNNVMAPEFDVEFFSKFSIVLNALDNLAARRHVNRMCLAAGVPLVESGTAGFLGQVAVHVKGVSSCYECEAKPAPKGFPTCTITNTPSKPIHCIVWAKELPFQKLFGDKSTPSDLDTVRPSSGEANMAGSSGEGNTAGSSGEGNTAEAGSDGPRISQAAGKSSAAAAGEDVPGQAAEADFFAPREGEGLEEFSRRVFDRLFGENVAETLKMEGMWKSRRKPTPHFVSEILKEDATTIGPEPQTGGALAQNGGAATEEKEQNGGASLDLDAQETVSAAASLDLSNEHQVWSLEDNARLFLECIKTFFKKRSKDIGSLTFDKDDSLAVEFVTAAANIRSHSFGIPMQSLFEVKGMAGRIIHAVATTNAMIAGIAVLHAIRLLRNGPQSLQMTWCHKLVNGKGLLLDSIDADEPHPSCLACSQTALVLELNTSTSTLGAIISDVIKGQVGVVFPTITRGDALLYEEGADLDEAEVAMCTANAEKKLTDFSKPIGHGSVLTVEDYQQQFRCEIHIKHRDEVDLEQHPSGMILHGEKDSAASKTKKGKREASKDEHKGEDENNSNDDDDDDDLVMVEAGADAPAGTTRHVTTGDRGQAQECHAKGSSTIDPTNGQDGGNEDEEDEMVEICPKTKEPLKRKREDGTAGSTTRKGQGEVILLDD